MNTFKRILSAVLSAAMTISAASMISVGAANIQFTDVSDHWAWTNGQIPYLVEKGVLNGYEQANGTYMFKPDGNVKRSEFIKMLDETFGLTKTTSISYADVPSDQWYYTYFQKAAAQGYILDYGTHVNPSGEITREEAAALLVRYLDLPTNEMAESSTFSDYSDITSYYREYVLRAVHAGIINGYSENGKTLFKPQKTLTRAEALTILYRAAGCIFNESANYRSGKASSQNNTITDTGITISNTVLNGRNIVTEGAEGGKITFTGCTIRDTLYVRGSASLVLDDCEIDKLVLLGGGNITLVGKTKVNTIDVGRSTTFTTYDGTKIGTLNVEYGADYTKVNGTVSIGMANIRARDFYSAVVPEEFEIGNNLTAYFDENGFQGSSETQNAFTLAPFSTADDSYYYLNLIPNADGDVYYYYTNIANTPSSSAFHSYYSNATEYGVFEVREGEAVSHETLIAAKAANFDYVVVQLRYGGKRYAPVLIENKGKIDTGFKTDPYLYDKTTIKFDVKESGTICWFYADDGKQLTQLEFLNIYENKESAFKGTEDVSNIKTLSCHLNEKYIKNYDFVAFMLITSGDDYHTPVVVSVGDTGFTEAPIVKTPGVITFRSSVAGEIYYYYSADTNLPSTTEFKSTYNSADEKGNKEIYANITSTVEFDLDEIEDYPYMIMSIRDNNGKYKVPVVVDINFTTGFRDEPEVTKTSEITFRTKLDGSVAYYYTTNEIAPSIEEFHKAYGEQRYKGTKKVSSYVETINYEVGYAAIYPFMVIMFTDETGKEYSPVLIELDASLDTGFAIAPFVKDGYVHVTAEESGEVWYYYSKSSSAVDPYDFEEVFDSVSDSSRKHTFEVDGGESESFAIDREIVKKYPYIVIAFTDEISARHPDFSVPFVLDVTMSEASNTGSALEISNLNSDLDSVIVTVQYDGDLYWYCTNDKTDVPAGRHRFMEKYNAAAESGRARGLEVGDYEQIEFKDYDYLVCALRIGDEFLQYIVIHHENGIEIEKEDDNVLNQYDKDSYGFEFEGWNKNDLTVIPLKSGKMTLFALQNGIPDVIETQNVNISEEVVFDISLTQNSIISSILFNIRVEFYLQLTDDDGYVYRPFHLEELN